MRRSSFHHARSNLARYVVGDRSGQRNPARRLLSGSGGEYIVSVADGAPVLVRETFARETHLFGTGQRPDGSGGDLTGLRVWEAAPKLVRHLERNADTCLVGKTLVDLGCGTGAVGLAAAAFGAKHVVLSDADSAATVSTENGYQSSSVLEELRGNVALNPARVQSVVSVEELQWGNAEHIAALLRRWPGGFDTIVASDVLYYKPEETYDALAQTIRALAAPAARVVLAYMVRHGHEHTFADLLITGGAVLPGSSAESDVGPLFEVVGRNAADEASRTAATHATRVVELQRVQE